MQENFLLLKSVLEKLHKAGCLEHFILVGSWASYFYRFHFQSPDYLPQIRTSDVDFLIPNPRRVDSNLEINVGGLLEELHFVKSYSRTGLVKYESKGFTIEFLVPEVGRGSASPMKIEGLSIVAQPLRFLNMLTDHPLAVSYEGMKIKVPEPIAYAFHKLVISGRRLEKEKQSKDYFTAVELLRFLKRAGRGDDIKKYFHSLRPGWKQKIDAILKNAKEFEILKDLSNP